MEIVKMYIFNIINKSEGFDGVAEDLLKRLL